MSEPTHKHIVLFSARRKAGESYTISLGGVTNLSRGRKKLMVETNLVRAGRHEMLTAALKEAIKPLPGLNVTWRLTTTQQMLSQGVGGIFPPQERFQ